MGVYTFTMADHTSKVASGRLFKALCLDNHNLVPKILPQSFKSIELVEGDSTVVGCIKQFNFPEGSPFKYVKNRVDELDLEKFYIKYTTFEGDIIGDKLECVVYETKIEPSGTESKYTLTGHFHTKGDTVMIEDDVKAGQVSIKKIHEAVEEYLLANPEVYA